MGAYPKRYRATGKIGERERGLGEASHSSHYTQLRIEEERAGGEALLRPRVFSCSSFLTMVL